MGRNAFKRDKRTRADLNVGSASPEPFTAVPHELLEALTRVGLCGTEWDCMAFLMRWTYGWHRETARIGTRLFAKRTGRHRNAVVHALRELQRKNIIECVDSSTFRSAATYRIVPAEQWRVQLDVPVTSDVPVTQECAGRVQLDVPEGTTGCASQAQGECPYKESLSKKELKDRKDIGADAPVRPPVSTDLGASPLDPTGAAPLDPKDEKPKLALVENPKAKGNGAEVRLERQIKAWLGAFVSEHCLPGESLILSEGAHDELIAIVSKWDSPGQFANCAAKVMLRHTSWMEGLHTPEEKFMWLARNCARLAEL